MENNKVGMGDRLRPEREGKHLPVKSFKAGPVKATVWENPSLNDNGAYHTISLERTYKDKNGAWQKTTSMRINDLPKAAMVLSKAYEHLLLNSNELKAET